MSIIMKNVKAITISGHNVKKIEDKNGNVLWESSQLHTINITVGAGQDITTTQYAEGIVLPSLNDIKSKIASKTGISSSSITIKKAMIQNNTLYWRVGSNYNNGTTYYGRLSFGGGLPFESDPVSQTETHTYPWNSSSNSYSDVTYYLKDSSTTLSQGYIGIENEELGTPFVTSRYNNKEAHFCSSTNVYALPTYTLVVTYEY